MNPTFSGGVDHIHVYVPSRYAAAQWYRDNLGFHVVESLAFWAKPVGGPLTIADEGDAIHLALFRSDESRPASLAFGATAQEYLAWHGHLSARGIEIAQRDHKKAWSTYFTDPFGNQLEITCYDHEALAAR